MSGKCVVISSCVCFVIILSAAIVFVAPLISRFNHDGPSLILYKNGLISVEFSLWSTGVTSSRLKSPSLKSFIQASTAEKSLSGLAVYLNLTNACQPLDDVNNANIQVHKIALVTLVNESACTLQDLAGNVQNAGYSVLMMYVEYHLGVEMPPLQRNLPTQKKLVIPVVDISPYYQFDNSHYRSRVLNKTTVEQFLSDADRTNVDILCPDCNTSGEDELSKMESYLVRLYYWFLVGPLITLEWLRRTKKLCWMSGGQQVDEQQAVVNENVPENEILTMEEGENGNEPLSNRHLLSNDDESIGTHREREGLREGEYGSQRGEEQPLLIPVDENTRQLRGTGSVDNMKKIFHKGVMRFAYIILIIAALPICISSGGLSFFRFDQGASSSLILQIATNSFLSNQAKKTTPAARVMILFIVFLWSPFQIFCFFLYSRFACNNTWTVPTTFSKLIRSDWFASNIYLLVLAVVVPYCTSSYNFGYFAIYNIVCTVCNVLFIIIVNKHKFVTRYVFYISVCMICAYIQSDIVAVFYFALNSEGSLNNLKLTALRTVAIGLTFTVSFSSSMHIIRKLYKPQESLFEGLGEK